jgi:ribonuclease P protein component
MKRFPSQSGRLPRTSTHETHLSAKRPAPPEDARVPRAHEHEEGPARTEAPPGQGPQAAVGVVVGGSTLRPQERVRRRPEFQRIFDEGVRLHGRLMTLVILPNSLDVARLGVVATRRLGGAVSRNRAKRRARELFRTSKVAGGFDVVVIPRTEFLEATLESLRTEYCALLRRFTRKRGQS